MLSRCVATPRAIAPSASACCSVAAAAAAPARPLPLASLSPLSPLSRRASSPVIARAEPAESSSSSSSSVGSESTTVDASEIAAATAKGEGTGGGGGGSAEAAVWAATATADNPRVRFYVSMTLKHRWPIVWSDIIMDRVAKMDLDVSQRKLDQMVAFLQAVGINEQDVCYMAAVAPGILARSAKRHALPLYNYLKGRVRGKGARAAVLREYPRLIEYDVVGEGDAAVLVRGNARASVDVVKGNVGVSFWREGAVFSSAPVSPMVPTPERK